MDRNDLRSVARQLLFGGPGSVDLIALQLVALGDRRIWDELVETIHSQEDLSARVRCLEVLGRAASTGADTAEAILDALGTHGE